MVGDMMERGNSYFNLNLTDLSGFCSRHFSARSEDSADYKQSDESIGGISRTRFDFTLLGIIQSYPAKYDSISCESPIEELLCLEKLLTRIKIRFMGFIIRFMGHWLVMIN
ncbi:MAG: hypothetical protein RIB93_07435 [Coleofasciculus sp. D1-CHI-01]|uniref:hypothetical protein n=1 Tax=Coleofasciculus sp. D1-CHI-01 TaxID=3068482 RepID=UPI0032FDFD89